MSLREQENTEHRTQNRVTESLSNRVTQGKKDKTQIEIDKKIREDKT